MNTSQDLASARIAIAIALLQGMFPALNISHGYIGNCTVSHDDRSWRVFTNMTDWLGYTVAVWLDGPGEFNVVDVAQQLEHLAAKYGRTRPAARVHA